MARRRWSMVRTSVKGTPRANPGWSGSRNWAPRCSEWDSLDVRPFRPSRSWLCSQSLGLSSVLRGRGTSESRSSRPAGAECSDSAGRARRGGRHAASPRLRQSGGCYRCGDEASPISKPWLQHSAAVVTPRPLLLRHPRFTRWISGAVEKRSLDVPLRTPGSQPRGRASPRPRSMSCAWDATRRQAVRSSIRSRTGPRMWSALLSDVARAVSRRIVGHRNRGDSVPSLSGQGRGPQALGRCRCADRSSGRTGRVGQRASRSRETVPGSWPSIRGG